MAPATPDGEMYGFVLFHSLARFPVIPARKRQVWRLRHHSPARSPSDGQPASDGATEGSRVVGSAQSCGRRALIDGLIEQGAKDLNCGP